MGINKYAGLGLGDLSWAGILATGGAGAVGGFLIDRYIRKKKDLSSNALWGLGGFGVGALGSVAWQYAQKAIEDKRTAEKGDVAKRDVTNKSPEDARALRESAIKRTHPGMTDEPVKELYTKQETDTGVVPPEQKEWDARPGYGAIGGTAVGGALGSKDIIEGYKEGGKYRQSQKEAFEKQIGKLDKAAKPGKGGQVGALAPSKIDTTKFPDMSRVRQIEVNEPYFKADGKVYIGTPGKTVIPVTKNGKVVSAVEVDMATAHSLNLQRVDKSSLSGNKLTVSNNTPQGKQTYRVDVKPVKPISNKTRVYAKNGDLLQSGKLKTPEGDIGLLRSSKANYIKGGAKTMLGTGVGYVLDFVGRNSERIADAMVNFGKANIDPLLRHAGRQAAAGASEVAAPVAKAITPRY